MEPHAKEQHQGDINPPDSLLTDVLARLGLFQSSSPVSIDDLESADWQKQAQAIQTFGSQIPFNRLLEIASDFHKHEAVRSAALRALGKLGKQAPVHLLVDILRDSDAHRDVRATALNILGELREQGVHGTKEYIIGELTGCLTDTDDIIRITAVHVAGIMGKQLPSSQQNQLKKMLRTDPSWHVRETVALTLGMLGEYSTVMKALYDTDRFVRDAARLALQQHISQVLDMLVGTLAYGKPAEREQAARALGEMGTYTPIKNLENAALMDNSSNVRKAAVLALGQLEARIPAATLSHVVLQDKDEDVREAAQLVLSTIEVDSIAIEDLPLEKQTDALTADFRVDEKTDNQAHPLSQQEEEDIYIRSHNLKKGYIGKEFGSYKLVKQLDEHKSRGPHVYLGEHIFDGTQVAIKVFPSQTSLEEGESFRQAVGIIAQLKQPNIVPIVSFGVEHGTPFIVMDYMSGGNVRQHYPQGQRVPFSTIKQFVKRLAEALQYAHNHKPPVMHQDIKPENLLLNAEGNIFLSDFGFEQSILQTSSKASKSASPNYYLAPEQLEVSRMISAATDQYALAAIVYEWLCGRPPFEGKPTEIVRKIRTATPPALREQVSHLPQQVENVVMQALAKQPLQRFATVQAFAHAFTAAFGI